jgi:hypothetical protein
MKDYIYFLIAISLLYLLFFFNKSETFSSENLELIRQILEDKHTDPSVKISMIKRTGITEKENPIMYKYLYDNKIYSEQKVSDILEYLNLNSAPRKNCEMNEKELKLALGEMRNQLEQTKYQIEKCS